MFEQAFRNIDDVLRKEAGCTTELDYTEQTSWLLFLKYLDGLEADKALEAQLHTKKYAYILDAAYRWESWAAPKNADGKPDHQLAKTGTMLISTSSAKPTPFCPSFCPCEKLTQPQVAMRMLRIQVGVFSFGFGL